MRSIDDGDDRNHVMIVLLAVLVIVAITLVATGIIFNGNQRITVMYQHEDGVFIVLGGCDGG